MLLLYVVLWGKPQLVIRNLRRTAFSLFSRMEGGICLLLYSYESVHIILLHYCSILYSCTHQYICIAFISSNIATFVLYSIIFMRNTEIALGMYPQRLSREKWDNALYSCTAHSFVIFSKHVCSVFQDKAIVRRTTSLRQFNDKRYRFS